MSEYAIEIQNLDFKQTDYTIFYSDNTLSVYREGPYVRAVDSTGEQLHKMRLPINFKHFESVDLGDSVMLMFSGEQMIIMSKTTSQITAFSMDTNKIGKSITEMKIVGPTSFVVGTRSRGYVQFVNYDFEKQSRVSQTSSWKMSSITDFDVKDDKIFAVLDKSLFICVDANTCELLWSRFETTEISPRIISDGNEYFFCSGGVIKHLKPEIESIKIPLFKILSIEAKFGSHIIAQILDGKGILAYDLVGKETRWQIRSENKIEQTIPIKILSAGKLNDALAIRSKDYFSIIDCVKGKIAYSTEFKNIAYLKKTGSNLLVYRYNGTTGIIKGTLC